MSARAGVPCTDVCTCRDCHAEFSFGDSESFQESILRQLADAETLLAEERSARERAEARWHRSTELYTAECAKVDGLEHRIGDLDDELVAQDAIWRARVERLEGALRKAEALLYEAHQQEAKANTESNDWEEQYFRSEARVERLEVALRAVMDSHACTECAPQEYLDRHHAAFRQARAAIRDALEGGAK